MAITPPDELINSIAKEVGELLESNPAASMSESFIQHTVEFGVLDRKFDDNYFLRIGINYHGNKVQHLKVDESSGKLVGWNRDGDALGRAAKAKMLLAGVTIFDRDPNEQLMSDTKIGGGNIPDNRYVRVEFKARGWLGKTKNLAGKELIKDIELLRDDKADLLVICLSETAHLKWLGRGSEYQRDRRTGLDRFSQIFIEPEELGNAVMKQTDRTVEGQRWRVRLYKFTGKNNSVMPGAVHYVTMCWRVDIN